MSKILVVGGSGTVGTEVSAQLRQQGHEAIRTTSKPATSADQRSFDIVSGRGLEHLFDGIERAFFMVPPGLMNQDALLRPLVDAARAAKLQKVVLMTAIGVNASDDIPFRKAELYLQQSGLAWNVIRPNWFMQNFHTYWLKGILEENRVFLPVGDARASFIDARDIAATAAALLTEERFDNREFDLTGPESLTHAEAADLIREVSGRPVSFQDVAPDEALRRFHDAGLPAAYAEFLVTILGYLKAGAVAYRTDAVREITGREPIHFAQYARDHRSAWA
jgi:uncharacterized protein YbjT (DUF2867 family)